MTVADFLKQLEGYYGPFQRVEQRKHVAAYLDNEWSDEELPDLFKWCLETIAARYNYVPDIAAFEEIRPKLRERLYLTANTVPPARQITEDGEGFIDKEEGAKLFEQLHRKLKGEVPG